MITLITGTPGTGKTLRLVELLVEIRQSDDPAVRSRLIYTNVNGLDESLGCLTLADFDPLRWMDLPDGCMIVVDECQDFWPARPSGSKRPESVAALNTHRHRGIDLILLSQFPSLVDHDIRALVGCHYHGYRPRNLEHTQWYEWSYCENHCQPKLKPIPEKKKFKPELFQLYKSTVENTHKPASWWPVIKKLILPVALIVGGIGLFLPSWIGMAGGSADKPIGASAETSAPAPIYQAEAGGVVAPAPQALDPVAALPRIEYHGFYRWRGVPSLLLCVPDPDGGCVTELEWSQVVHWRRQGSAVVIQGGSTGPDLYRLDDPNFFLDAVQLGIAI